MNSITSLQRTDLAQLIVNRISQEKDRIKIQYEVSKNQIGYFFIDDLLASRNHRIHQQSVSITSRHGSQEKPS